MRTTVYIVLLAVLVTMFSTTGCTEKATTETDSIVDSIAADTIKVDTLETLLDEKPVPKAADELFDDFFFNFAGSRKFQMSRIEFPLNVEDASIVTTIERDEWAMERFFMPQGFYTLVAGSLKEVEASKSTKLENVTIEKIFFRKDKVKQYLFCRTDGQWKMNVIRIQSMEENANGSFYHFYDKFVNDSVFQRKALAETIEFSGPDPEDDFSRIDGVIASEQWSLFAPELPRDMIYNIVYGTPSVPSGQRVLVVRGIANGLETELTFRKAADSWRLVKLTL